MNKYKILDENEQVDPPRNLNLDMASIQRHPIKKGAYKIGVRGQKAGGFFELYPFVDDQNKYRDIDNPVLLPSNIPPVVPPAVPVPPPPQVFHKNIKYNVVMDTKALSINNAGYITMVNFEPWVYFPEQINGPLYTSTDIHSAVEALHKYHYGVYPSVLYSTDPLNEGFVIGKAGDDNKETYYTFIFPYPQYAETERFSTVACGQALEDLHVIMRHQNKVFGNPPQIKHCFEVRNRCISTIDSNAVEIKWRHNKSTSAGSVETTAYLTQIEGAPRYPFTKNTFCFIENHLADPIENLTSLKYPVLFYNENSGRYTVVPEGLTATDGDPTSEYYPSIHQLVLDPTIPEWENEIGWFEAPGVENAVGPTTYMEGKYTPRGKYASSSVTGSLSGNIPSGQCNSVTLYNLSLEEYNTMNGVGYLRFSRPEFDLEYGSFSSWASGLGGNATFYTNGILPTPRYNGANVIITHAGYCYVKYNQGDNDTWKIGKMHDNIPGVLNRIPTISEDVRAIQPWQSYDPLTGVVDTSLKFRLGRMRVRAVGNGGSIPFTTFSQEWFSYKKSGVYIKNANGLYDEKQKICLANTTYGYIYTIIWVDLFEIMEVKHTGWLCYPNYVNIYDEEFKFYRRDDTLNFAMIKDRIARKTPYGVDLWFADRARAGNVLPTFININFNYIPVHNGTYTGNFGGFSLSWNDLNEGIPTTILTKV